MASQNAANNAVVFLAVVVGAIVLLVLVAGFCGGMASRGVF